MVTIPEEVFKKGTITIYKDTDRELLNAVWDYNNNVSGSRLKAKYINEILCGFYVLNSLVILCMVVSLANKIFRIPALAISLLILYAAFFLIFAVSKKNLFLSSVAVSLLVILDLRFLIIFVFDILLYYIYRKRNNDLKKEVGYPNFFDIRIRYGNSNDNKEKY